MSTRRRSAGLQTRLLALVLVPAILLALLGGGVAQRRRSQATEAAEVRSGVGALTGLVDLRSALLLARTPIEVEIRAAALGIAPTDALGLLDLQRSQLGDLGEVSRTLRALPPDVRPFTLAEVASLERTVQAGARVGVLDRFHRLEQAVEDTWDRRLDALQEKVVVLGDRGLDRSLSDLSRASTAGSAMAGLLTGLADYWFGIVGRTNRVGPARAAISVDHYRFLHSIDQLRRSSDPAVRQAAVRIRRAWDRGPFGDAIDDAVAGRPARPFVGSGVDLTLIVDTFTDSFRQFQPLLDLVTARAQVLERSAGRIARAANADATRTLVGLAVVVLLLVVLSLVIATSFERPLRRLIDATRRVGDGDLSADRLPTRGPPEVAAASEAINDVVANLRLLEGKVEALAASDLADPRLAQPLPGELGHALAAPLGDLAESIAERADLQARLLHQATHDPLTGIANRAGALEGLVAALARSQRAATPVAVAFLDLDGFKRVNDTHGHAAGDRVLLVVAERLARHARTGDVVARMGGDEFVIVAEHVNGPEDAVAMGRRIAAAIREPIDLLDLPPDPHGHRDARSGPVAVHIGASVGIALSIDAEEAPMDLLHRADLAAYRAKRSGTVAELALSQLSPTDLA